MSDHDPVDDVLTEAHTCAVLAIDADALHTLILQDQVLEIRAIGGNGYPAFQFGADGTLLPGLREVIEEPCVVNDQRLWWLWLLKQTPEAPLVATLA